MQEVRCIGKGQDLTIGKVYTVLYETTTLFSIKNDSDHVVGYGKGLFENVPAGKVMRCNSHNLIGLTFGKNYNVEPSDMPGRYRIIADDGKEWHVHESYFIEPSEPVSLEEPEQLRYVGTQVDGKLTPLYNMWQSLIDSRTKIHATRGGRIFNVDQRDEFIKNLHKASPRLGIPVNMLLGGDRVNESHKYRVPIPQGMEYLDVYRICALYEIDDTSGAVHHAIKKLLKMGKRGYKDRNKDLQEVIDTLTELQKLGEELCDE